MGLAFYLFTCTIFCTFMVILTESEQYFGTVDGCTVADLYLLPRVLLSQDFLDTYLYITNRN